MNHAHIHVSYWLFIVIICMLTGWVILQVDVRKYSDSGMKKEAKASRIMGWINIAVGTLLLIAQWTFGIFPQ